MPIHKLCIFWIGTAQKQEKSYWSQLSVPVKLMFDEDATQRVCWEALQSAFPSFYITLEAPVMIKWPKVIDWSSSLLITCELQGVRHDYSILNLWNRGGRLAKIPLGTNSWRWKWEDFLQTNHKKKSRTLVYAVLIELNWFYSNHHMHISVIQSCKNHKNNEKLKLLK